MRARWTMALATLLFLSGPAHAQFTPVRPDMASAPSLAPAPAAAAPGSAVPAATAAPAAAPRGSAAASKGSGVLPNEHGQVWREYDISPYTSGVNGTEKPEQAVVDWVLRETGTQMWFSEPLGILSATRTTLRVYHTQQVQELVGGVVDRFVGGDDAAQTFSMRLVTLDNPNWRSVAQRMIRPVAVQSPGVEAWILSKEDAALLVGEIRKRTDFREHNAPNLVIYNGQTYALANTRPRSYVKAVNPRGDLYAGYELGMGQVMEGYTVEISPLLSVDGRTIDAVVKAEVDQVEKLEPVFIDVPTPVNPRQRVQIQVPQLASWRLHERFRWPADQVLLISRGVVATPAPGKAGPLGIGNLSPGPARADALLLLEGKGKGAAVAGADGTATPRVGSLNYGGRY
jgi:hypothetical protein